MSKMFMAHFGVLLLVLHLLSSQVVQTQNTTDASMNMTVSNSTMAPTTLVNVTAKDKNGCGRTVSFKLLLPLALAASLLPMT